jgi:hypothetical protein
LRRSRVSPGNYQLFGVCVRGFARGFMGGSRVIMSLPGVLVRFGRVLMGFLVVALEVVIGCQVVVPGCFFVVLRGFVMCFVCHFGFSCGKSPGAILRRAL